jgi:membrane-associated phospholipid phosphatase
LVLLSLHVHAQNADIRLLRKIYSPNALPSDGFFRFMSNSVSPVAISVPTFYFGMSLFQKEKNIRQNVWMQRTIRSGLSIGGAGLISYSLKYSIRRERPFDRYPDIVPKTHPATWSFPSGHTTFAFATATIVSLNHRKWYITVPMYAWAATVGYSRLHLGAHFPTDVLGGMVIGTGSSFLVYYLTKKWFGPKSKGVIRE